LLLSPTHSIARSLLRQRVRLSIHPSVTPTIVSKRLDLSQNLLEHLVAPCGAFWPIAPIPYSKGNPFSGGVKYTGVENRHLSSKQYEIDRWLVWNISRKSWVTDRMVSFSMTLNDPKPGFQGHCILTSRISQKRCILGTQLLNYTDRKPYTIYRMVPLSVTFDPISRSHF